jgi:two-component system, chemotaxis family, protein-glutamate methylesterase/glutaminase
MGPRVSVPVTAFTFPDSPTSPVSSAAGARAVKLAGGQVLVQDPTTAESPVAPRAVLARTPVDAVLPLEQIAAFLRRACGTSGASL